MRKVFFVLAVTSVAGALTPVAFASSLTAINFTCSGEKVAGPGTTTIRPFGSGCTASRGNEGLSGRDASNWSGTWYQKAASGTGTYTLTTDTTNDVNGKNGNNGRFTRSTTQLGYNSDGGFNWSSSTGGHANGTANNGIPALESQNDGNASQIEISDGKSTFLFDGFYFGETSTETLDYMIFGYDGNTLVYCIDIVDVRRTTETNSCSGNLSNAWDADFVTDKGSRGSIYYSLISNPDADIPVTSVYIDTEVGGNEDRGPNTGSYYTDNYLVTSTPEPRSLVLLGSGFVLIGLAMFRRRHQAAARPTMAA